MLKFNRNGDWMELIALFKRVIGLDVHQAQITACAIIEEVDGTIRIGQRQLRDRRALVVNARHVKNVPGRKTDIGDAQWLATLTRAGLLRGSFIPPALMRELRLISRQRQKLVGLLSSRKIVYTRCSPTAAFASAWWPVSVYECSASLSLSVPIPVFFENDLPNSAPDPAPSIPTIKAVSGSCLITSEGNPVAIPPITAPTKGKYRTRARALAILPGN
jgi:Transposase